AQREPRIAGHGRNRLRGTLVARQHVGNGVQALAVAGNRERSANDGLVLSEQLSYETFLVRVPGESEIRRGIHQVGGVGAPHLIDYWIQVAVQDARLEQAVRWTEEVISGWQAIDAVRVLDWAIELPTETVVQREGRLDPEAVLNVNAACRECESLSDRGELAILMALLIDVGRASDARKSTSQKRIQGRSIRKVPIA